MLQFDSSDEFVLSDASRAGASLTNYTWNASSFTLGTEMTGGTVGFKIIERRLCP